MRLSRITSDGRFVPEIDGLRFVAIASVVLYHLQTHVIAKGAVPFYGYAAIGNGFRGVQLFFVISGFILALPFARHAIHNAPKVNLRKYFLRRLTRLEPPYILNLLIASVFGALWLSSKHVSPWRLMPHLLASMGYLHNLIYGAKSAINPVAWSLEIEIQFYCLVPILACIFLIRGRFLRRGILIGIMCAALVWQIWLPQYPETILGQLQFFLAGFLLADLYLCDWKEAPTTHWSWDLISVAMWPFVFLFSSKVGGWCFPFVVLVLYCAAFRGTMFRRFFRHPLITTIGGMCYTTYLFHQLAILNAGHVLDRFHLGNNPHLYFITEAVLILPFVGLVSVVYFVLIERPCMDSRWPSKLLAAMKSRTSKAASPKAVAELNPGLMSSEP